MTLPIQLNGRVHSGPNCWTDFANGAIYHTHVEADGHQCVSKTVIGGSTTTVRLEDLSGDPFAQPADTGNDHLAATVAQDSDGYVYVAANMHGDALRCVRFDTPNSITGSFTSMASTFQVDVGEVCTYPSWDVASDGTLLFWIRRRVPDASNNLGSFGAWIKRPGQAWAWQGKLGIDDAHDQTAYGPEDAGKFLFYAHCPSFGRDDVLRVTTAWLDWGFTFRRHDLGYMESHDFGATWQAVDGTPISTPITYATRGPQLIGIDPGGTYNIENGPPVVTSTGTIQVLVSDLNGTTYRLRWNGSAWAQFQVVFPVLTSRSRLAYLKGACHIFGVENNRVVLRNVESPVSTQQFGPRVDSGFEPPFDPPALRRGILRVGTVDHRGNPVVRSIGGGPRSLP